MKNSKEGYRNAERVMKGVANHRRIEVMSLLRESPELSVTELTKELKIDFRTASEHTRKLVQSGLVMKRSDSVSVRHRLTKLGEQVLNFLATIAND